MRKLLNKGKYFGKKGTPTPPKKIEKPKKTLKTKLIGKKNPRTVELQPKLQKFFKSFSGKRRSKKNHHSQQSPAKLRKTFTPGTVCIVLSGRYAGKRVVFLKQLSESGLVCCTGPFKLNGVPLRRFQPKKLIATSTKVDLTGVTVPEQVNDKLFAREIIPKPKRSEQEFFNKAEKPKKEIIKRSR